MWGPISQEEADSRKDLECVAKSAGPLASGAIQMGVRSLQSGRSGSPLCSPSLVRAAPSFPEVIWQTQPDRNLPARAKGAKENSQVLQTGPCLNPTVSPGPGQSWGLPCLSQPPGLRLCPLPACPLPGSRRVITVRPDAPGPWGTWAPLCAGLTFLG